MAVIQWLRRSFLAGFFVTIPLVISVFALVWIFGIIDSFTAPLARWALGDEVPVAGTLPDYAARFAGVLVTLLVVLTVGAVTTNVIGRRVLARAESWLMMIPVFRTIYAPVKQLVVAFSPDNETGFKRVVMVDDPSRGWVSDEGIRGGPRRRSDDADGRVCADQSSVSRRHHDLPP
jgi:uncharacterized membrane protein